MTNKRAARDIAHQLRTAAVTASEAETRVYVELVKAERDPDRVWSTGDLDLSFESFLEGNGLADVRAYRAFASGLKLIGGRTELPLFIGLETVTYASEMASPDQVAEVVRIAKTHREQHGVVPDRTTLRCAMGYAVRSAAATSPV